MDNSNSLKSFERSKQALKPGEDLEFQTFSWEETDISDKNRSLYSMFAFGVDSLGRSVCLKVDGFMPFFYVRVRNGFGDYDRKTFMRKLSKEIGFYHSKSIIHKMCKVEMHKDLYGFSNGRRLPFLKLVFSSCFAMYKARKTCSKEFGMRVYNAKTSPLLRFAYMRGVRFCNWIKVNARALSIPMDSDGSRCQLYYECNWTNVRGNDETKTLAKFTTLSFDIECFSHDGSFPDPINPANVITQIGSGFSKYGSDDVLKHVIVLGDCAPLQNGGVLETVQTEEELIMSWVNLIEKTDPDFLIGYNIDDFDWSYIDKRARLLGISEEVYEKISRTKFIRGKFNDDSLETSAFGVNIFRYIYTPGINQLDLLHWFRKNKKLNSFSLDNVSKKFLDNEKHPVSPQEIFEMSGPEGTPESRRVVAEYCCHDTFLPLRLMQMFKMVINMIEVSKVSRVPFMYLVTRGETIKVLSLLSYAARKEGYLVPQVRGGSEHPFQGAHVIEPERGEYTEPVSGLDFASLYPSIMIAWNLCPSTFVIDPNFLGIEGVEYKTFKWDGREYTFVQNKPGVTQGILKELWEGRKLAKKEMNNTFFKAKNETDPVRKAELMQQGDILNGKQLAIKVSMNSVYGAYGAPNFVVPCRAISSTVTFVGREMLNHSKKCAETWYDGSGPGGVKARVIYGDTDSIYTKFTFDGMGDLPEEYLMHKIWKISSECADRISKEFKDPIMLEMEKIMCPLYLYGKKRYANLSLELQKDGTFSKKQDFKGVQVVRRDNCKYVKTVCKPIYDKLLNEKDSKGAKNIARKMVRELLMGKVALEELVLSKSLKKSYKTVNKNGQPLPQPMHYVLAQKMRARDPMNAPKPGDRVQYLFVENPKAKLQADKVEDPEYARNHPRECKPDVIFYLDRQLASPLYTIFEVLVKDPEGKVYPRKVLSDGRTEISRKCKERIANTLWARERTSAVNRNRGQSEITKWFSPKKK